MGDHIIAELEDAYAELIEMIESVAISKVKQSEERRSEGSFAMFAAIRLASSGRALPKVAETFLRRRAYKRMGRDTKHYLQEAQKCQEAADVTTDDMIKMYWEEAARCWLALASRDPNPTPARSKLQLEREGDGRSSEIGRAWWNKQTMTTPPDKLHRRS